MYFKFLRLKNSSMHRNMPTIVHTIYYAKNCTPKNIISRRKVPRWPTTSAEILECMFNGHFTIP